MKKTLIALSAGILTFTWAFGQEAPVAEMTAPAAPAAEGEASDSFFKTSLGLSSKSGNTESYSYSGRIETGTTINKTILDMMIEGAYAESEVVDADGNKSDEQTEGKVKGVANAKQRFNGFFLYGNGSALHDSIAGINFRGIIGTGIGTYLVDEDNFKFTIEGGVAYAYEEAYEDDDYFTLRFAERMDYKFSDTVTFWESVEVLPEASDMGNFLLSAEAGVDSAISEKTSIGLLLQIEHDSDPSSGVEEKTDTTIGARVTYSI